jgi:hypothetical protein
MTAPLAPPAARPSSGVPAPALPNWPPSTNPVQPGSAAAEYDRWAKGQSQRPHGRVYGNPDGPGPAQMTTALSRGGHPLENSGSLTGHILSQGQVDRPAPKRNVAKVAIVLVVILVVLAGVGAAVVFGVGDSFNKLFEGLIN